MVCLKCCAGGNLFYSFHGCSTLFFDTQHVVQLPATCVQLCSVSPEFDVTF